MNDLLTRFAHWLQCRRKAALESRIERAEEEIDARLEGLCCLRSELAALEIEIIDSGRGRP